MCSALMRRGQDRHGSSSPDQVHSIGWPLSAHRFTPSRPITHCLVVPRAKSIVIPNPPVIAILAFLLLSPPNTAFNADLRRLRRLGPLTQR